MGGSSERMQVLVVDDDPLVCQSIRRGLSRRHDVSIALTAEAALQLLDVGQRYDVILCDVYLGPGMSGIDLADQLSKLDPVQLARLVFVAANPTSRRDEVRLQRPVVLKPFGLGELETTVRRTAEMGTSPRHAA